MTPPAPMIFRRPDGRLVWVCPGAPVSVLEQLHPNYGRLLLEMTTGALEPVSLPAPEAMDQLARLAGSPPPPSPVRRGPWPRARTG